MAGFTIAIATYNRSAELRQTLMSLTRLRDACPHEILVIANRCTDDTLAVVSQLEPLFSGRLRCIDEPRQGLSHARNRAIAEARFPIVAYLDDDVDVAAGWLEALDRAYATGNIAAVGGRAHLVYPCHRPAWLGDQDEGYLTRVELGDDRRLARPDELYGVNLSISTEWIRRVGGFRTDLGRSGNNLIGDEEGEILQRIAAAGGAILYEPEAVVGHRVSPARLRRRWFWRRCFDGHRGVVRMTPAEKISSIELLRVTWRLVRAVTGAAAALPHGPASQVFFHASMLVAKRAGIWVGTVARLVSPRLSRMPLIPSPSALGKVE